MNSSRGVMNADQLSAQGANAQVVGQKSCV
jgi:hypothetical protein